MQPKSRKRTSASRLKSMNKKNHDVYRWKSISLFGTGTDICNQCLVWYKFVSDLLLFSSGTPVYSPNKTVHHDINEIVLKVKVTCIKRSHFSSTDIQIFIWIEPLFRDHLSFFKAIFSRWPLNTGLPVYNWPTQYNWNNVENLVSWFM